MVAGFFIGTVRTDIFDEFDRPLVPSLANILAVVVDGDRRRNLSFVLWSNESFLDHDLDWLSSPLFQVFSGGLILLSEFIELESRLPCCAPSNTYPSKGFLRGHLISIRNAV